MKRAAKSGGTARARGVAKTLIAVASGPAIAIAYCIAAGRDERTGYRLTAAFEWRKAAELLAIFPSMADHCWQQWERITNLPRRLAEPASFPQQRPVGIASHRSPEPVAAPVNDVLLSVA